MRLDSVIMKMQFKHFLRRQNCKNPHKKTLLIENELYPRTLQVWIIMINYFNFRSSWLGDSQLLAHWSPLRGIFWTFCGCWLRYLHNFPDVSWTKLMWQGQPCKKCSILTPHHAFKFQVLGFILSFRTRYYSTDPQTCSTLIVWIISSQQSWTATTTRMLKLNETAEQGRAEQSM